MVPRDEACQDNDLPAMASPEHKTVIQNPLARLQSSSCTHTTDDARSELPFLCSRGSPSFIPEWIGAPGWWSQSAGI